MYLATLYGRVERVKFLCTHEVCASARQDPILSLGVRWQSYACLVERAQAQQCPPKCNVHLAKVCGNMGQYFLKRDSVHLIAAHSLRLISKLGFHLNADCHVNTAPPGPRH